MTLHNKLLADHEKYIDKIAYRICSNKHDRMILVNRGREEFLKALKTYDPTKSKLTTYMRDRLVGVMLDERRKLKWFKRDDKYEIISLESVKDADLFVDIDEQLETFEQNEIVKNAIKLLPDVEKNLIIYHYWYGYTFYEISDLLGLSFSWCSKLHIKVLTKLKELIEEAKK